MGTGPSKEGRPLCPCHGEPMDTWREDGRQRTRCAVRRRARQLADYHANPVPQIYARGRALRLQRMRAKEARVAQLEDSLAREV